MDEGSPTCSSHHAICSTTTQALGKQTIYILVKNACYGAEMVKRVKWTQAFTSPPYQNTTEMTLNDIKA